MATSPLTSLAANSDGALAYGTAGGGASLLANGQWQTLAAATNFPAANRIYSLATDGGGYLWVASSGGVQQANPGAPEARLHMARQRAWRRTVCARFLPTAPAQSGWAASVQRISTAPPGRIMAQTRGLPTRRLPRLHRTARRASGLAHAAGLSIWTGSTFFNLTSANGLPDAEILSLAADANSVWIGSANGGLYRFENNQLQVLTQENVGLPSNRILALLVAPDRSLYVGTDAGMVRFPRRIQPGARHADRCGHIIRARRRWHDSGRNWHARHMDAPGRLNIGDAVGCAAERQRGAASFIARACNQSIQRRMARHRRQRVDAPVACAHGRIRRVLLLTSSSRARGCRLL